MKLYETIVIIKHFTVFFSKIQKFIMIFLFYQLSLREKKLIYQNSEIKINLIFLI